jgi:hypothetical protein
MHSFNKVIAIDHDGLFIYIQAGFSGSFHDVRCLRQTDLFSNWRRYFQNENRDIVEEYLLGDPGYIGADMFILRHADNREADAANPGYSSFQQETCCNSRSGGVRH